MPTASLRSGSTTTGAACNPLTVRIADGCSRAALGRFRCGRDFSAWLGLTPVQRSTGSKQKLGQVSKMGERTLRLLLAVGVSAVIKQALLRGALAGSWPAQILSRKQRLLPQGDTPKHSRSVVSHGRRRLTSPA